MVGIYKITSPSDYFKIDTSCIRKVCTGKQEKTKNLIFKYL